LWIGYQKQSNTEIWITFRPIFQKNSTDMFKLKLWVYGSETGNSILSKGAVDLDRLPPGLSEHGWLGTAHDHFEDRYGEWIATQKEEKQLTNQESTTGKDDLRRKCGSTEDSAEFAPTGELDSDPDLNTVLSSSTNAPSQHPTIEPNSTRRPSSKETTATRALPTLENRTEVNEARAEKFRRMMEEPDENSLQAFQDLLHKNEMNREAWLNRDG
jgi:hypothetical protein